VLFADNIKNAGLVQVVTHRVMETSEDEGDGFLSQRLDQFGQHPHAGRVNVVERVGVEDQPAYGRLGARDGLPKRPLT
jgi:hypothetical protein